MARSSGPASRDSCRRQLRLPACLSTPIPQRVQVKAGGAASETPAETVCAHSTPVTAIALRAPQIGCANHSLLRGGFAGWIRRLEFHHRLGDHPEAEGG